MPRPRPLVRERERRLLPTPPSAPLVLAPQLWPLGVVSAVRVSSVSSKFCQSVSSTFCQCSRCPCALSLRVCVSQVCSVGRLVRCCVLPWARDGLERRSVQEAHYARSPLGLTPLCKKRTRPHVTRLPASAVSGRV